MCAERQRGFLDTNVLVYALDSSAGEKRDRAIALLEESVHEETGALSTQVLQELFVTVTAKLPHRLAVRDASQIVSDLGRMPTHSPSVADVVAAIDIHERQHVSFWDAMILQSARSLGCAVVWSEDLSHGQSHDGVEVRNPFL